MYVTNNNAESYMMSLNEMQNFLDFPRTPQKIEESSTEIESTAKATVEDNSSVDSLLNLLA